MEKNYNVINLNLLNVLLDEAEFYVIGLINRSNCQFSICLIMV